MYLVICFGKVPSFQIDRTFENLTRVARRGYCCPGRIIGVHSDVATPFVASHRARRKGAVVGLIFARLSFDVERVTEW